jgi:very-short-patch-repair endonuclease
VRVAGVEVDALFAAEKVIVELDSWTYHRSRDSFERDRERDARTGAAGYLTIRLTRAALTERGALTAKRIREILRQRA